MCVVVCFRLCSRITTMTETGLFLMQSSRLLPETFLSLIPFVC